MAKGSLVKNSLYNTIYKSLNVIFPLITTMYVSRILLPAGVGKIAAAQNVATYFTLIVALGLPTYGVKLIAGAAENKREVSRRFSELFVINVISTAVCTLAYYSIIFSVELYRKEIWLYCIMGLPIVLNIFSIDWFYQGIEEYKYIMKRSILVKIACFAAMLILVRSEADYLIYALILTLGTVLNYIFNVINLRGKVHFTLSEISIKQHLKPVFVLLAASLAVEIYALTGVTMLNAMCSEEIVGYYSNSIKGIKIIKNFITSICAAFLPRLSYYFAENRMDEFKALSAKGLKILLYLSVPAAFGCAALSEPIVMVLFGAEFAPAAATVRFLAPSIVTIAVSNFVGYQVLIATGHEKQMLYATICGAAINVAMNIMLIPQMQHNGAAVASFITELIVAITQYVMMVRIMKISIEWKYVMSVAGSGLIMFGLVWLCQLIPVGNILKCAISAVIGVAVYIGMTVLLKNEIASEVLGKVRKKLIRK